MKYNDILRSVRLEKGLTVVESANMLNMNKSMFSRLELGQTSIDPSHFKVIMDKLLPLPKKESSAMSISKIEGRKTAAEYEKELSSLIASRGDPETIRKLRRRISYAKWLEKRLVTTS